MPWPRPASGASQPGFREGSAARLGQPVHAVLDGVGEHQRFAGAAHHQQLADRPCDKTDIDALANGIRYCLHLGGKDAEPPT